MEKKDITGIVLAGGKSSRMGTDKSLIMLHNKPLIQYAIDIIKHLCQNIVISANTNKYEFTGCEVWPDEFPVQAPIIGIYSCLKRSPTNLNIVLSCDMPMITTSLFSYLLVYAKDYDIVVPVHENYLEPLCGIYQRSALPIMEKFIRSKNFALHEFIENTNHLSLKIPDNKFPASIFMNVNTLDDFNRLTV
jgi:molybdopterin-guanine dinucleotide biosynthesis protein A